MTQAWSLRSLLPGVTATPAAFHLATASCTFGTRKPTWLITVPSVPPLDGATPGRRCRKTTTPGNFTMSKSPGLAATPPNATKIFLLASTSRELRCQCPIVTPASFGGAGWAKAVPIVRLDTSQSADINAFMVASQFGCLRPFEGDWGEG